MRRSNAYAVVSALRERGFQRVADDHIPDDSAKLRARLRFHLETHDVLVLSGGVSVGRFDLVPKTLEELGVRTVFHKLAQRPGKPMWFGVAPSGAAVFGLPGNPVSTLVCLSRYVIPAIAEAMGTRRSAPERLALAAPGTHDLPTLPAFCARNGTTGASNHAAARAATTNRRRTGLMRTRSRNVWSRPRAPRSRASAMQRPPTCATPRRST